MCEGANLEKNDEEIDDVRAGFDDDGDAFHAQESTNQASTPATTTTNDTQDQGIKSDVKDAGHATKKATKKVYHKSKKTVKKGVHKSAEKTGDAAGKVEDKTQTPPQQ